MKKVSKRLALSTQTIRVLQTDDLAQVQGGTNSSLTGTTIINPTISQTGTSIINPTISQTGTSIIRTH